MKDMLINLIEKIKEYQVILLGLFLVLAIMFSAVVIGRNFAKDSITVTGSAYEIVKSDSASWVLNINVKNKTRAGAYATVKKQIPIVEKYLEENGISKDQISVMTPNTWETYAIDSSGHTTNEIAYYNFNQPLKINSKDVEKIKDLSVRAQDLLEQGVEVTSEAPEYQYSGLSDLKIKLLEQASIDAKKRAQAMLKPNHNRAGKIRSIKMGVFQITPADSNSVSDYGISDLTTIDKKATAVANVVFSIK